MWVESHTQEAIYPRFSLTPRPLPLSPKLIDHIRCAPSSFRSHSILTGWGRKGGVPLLYHNPELWLGVLTPLPSRESASGSCCGATTGGATAPLMVSAATSTVRLRLGALSQGGDKFLPSKYCSPRIQRRQAGGVRVHRPPGLEGTETSVGAQGWLPGGFFPGRVF